ncbi:MAG: penicillin-binding protein 2 [Armatimonadetes bacterium]|nr:penicillin-binding protein 2 [Armatimonadota bacterium]
MAQHNREAVPSPYSAKERDVAEAHQRLRRLTGLVAGLFMVLLVRFWYLQIAQGEYYRLKAEENRTADIELPAPRGLIRDRNGVILATTRPAFSVSVLPAEVVDLDALLKRLSELLQIPQAELAETYEKNRIGRFKPVPLARDVSREVITAVAEEQAYLPGVLIEDDPVRYYRRGAFATHLIGYVREINAEELQRLRADGYRPGDIIGKMGVEKLADRYLRGRVGKQSVQRDAHGNLLRILGTVPPAPGNTVNLTLDARVQQAAENGLRGRVGAAVAIDPRNGDVLALASSPTFDPTLFTRRVPPALYQKVFGPNTHSPMQNRAVASAQPPGSTFKIVTATALLQQGVITPRSTAHCPGALRIGNMSKRCWSRHGTVNVYGALAGSCDVFFYHYALALSARNPDPISTWAERFGLGQRTGIQILPEAPGNLPWRRNYRHWYPGDTANTAIGQGYITATPLQVAQMTSVIANGGTLYQPRVVRNVTDVRGRVIQEFPVQGKRLQGPDAIRPEVLKIVRDGLRQVVTSGTGRVAALDGIAVAGKTGSAEHHRAKKAHAWFTCYAPFEQPTIAIAVLVEEGWHGATVAAPVAKAMMEAYFGLDKPQPKDAPAAGRSPSRARRQPTPRSPAPANASSQPRPTAPTAPANAPQPPPAPTEAPPAAAPTPADTPPPGQPTGD